MRGVERQKDSVNYSCHSFSQAANRWKLANSEKCCIFGRNISKRLAKAISFDKRLSRIEVALAANSLCGKSPKKRPIALLLDAG